MQGLEARAYATSRKAPPCCSIPNAQTIRKSCELLGKEGGALTLACVSGLCRLKIAAILLLVLLLCGAVASGVMAVVAGQESAKARAATSQAEDALLAAEDAAFKAQEALRKAEEAEADAQIRKLVATQERDKARRENDVSISALLQSVVAPFVKDPVMLASEVCCAPAHFSWGCLGSR